MNSVVSCCTTLAAKPNGHGEQQRRRPAAAAPERDPRCPDSERRTVHGGPAGQLVRVMRALLSQQDRPRGLARTARKTRCPARIEYCGSIVRAEGLGDAEHDAAGQRAPQRAEPADDHRLEREDELRSGRLAGSNVERIAEERAGERGRGDRDRRSPGHRRGARGRRRGAAVSGSCAVARISRPNPVRRRNSCSPPSTSTATARISTPRYEMDSCAVSRQLPVASRPAAPPSERTSGEKTCSRAFWMTMASPKVVSSGISGPPRRLRASTVRCST